MKALVQLASRMLSQSHRFSTARILTQQQIEDNAELRTRLDSKINQLEQQLLAEHNKTRAWLKATLTPEERNRVQSLFGLVKDIPEHEQAYLLLKLRQSRAAAEQL